MEARSQLRHRPTHVTAIAVNRLVPTILYSRRLLTIVKLWVLAGF